MKDHNANRHPSVAGGLGVAGLLVAIGFLLTAFVSHARRDVVPARSPLARLRHCQFHRRSICRCSDFALDYALFESLSDRRE